MFNNPPYGILAGLGFLLVICLCCSLRASDKAVGSTASEVKEREIAFARTFADRDLDAFLDFVSPEAIFFSGNEPLRGHEAIANAWAPLFEDKTPPFSWHPDVIEILESGQLAISSGPIQNASGESIGRFNSIWRKDSDGLWRVIFDKGS